MMKAEKINTALLSRFRKSIYYVYSHGIFEDDVKDFVFTVDNNNKDNS
jgi:hypothetical protein